MTAPRGGLAGSAAVMFSGTAVSRMLGLVRNAVLALVLTVNVAGAANAFSVANKLPNIIYMLVAGGVLNAVLVPQIVRAMRRHDGGREYVDRLLTITGAGLAGLTVLLTAAAGLLVSLYGRQLGDWFPLAVAFAYWSIPQLFFYGLYTLLGQVLNARSSFGPYMWAPAVNNLVAIAGLGVFIAVYGTAATNDGADAAAWTPGRIALLAGTATLGVAAQALVLLVPLHRSGFRWRPRWGVRGTGLGVASRVALWAFAGLAVGQLGYLAVSNVAAAAATAGGGAADVAGNAAYDNAFLIYMLPQSLITVSLVTALFTRISQAAAAADVGKVRSDLSLGLRVVGVFTVFASVALAVLALPVVRVVLPTVTFAEARSVAVVTVALLVGLSALGAWTLVQRVYYAFEDARSLFFIQIPMSAIVVAGSVAGALLLEPRWWVPAAGLAMATSTIAGALIAYLRLRGRLSGLDGARVLRCHLRLGIAAGAAGLVGWGTLHLLGVGPEADAGMSTVLLASLLRVVVVGTVMVALYLVLLRLLHVDELDLLLRPTVRLFSGALRRVRTMAHGRSGGASGDSPRGSGPGPVDPDGTPPQARDDPTGPDHEERESGTDPGEGARVTEAAIESHRAERGTVLAGRYRLTVPVPTDLTDAEAWQGHDTILDRPVHAVVLTGPTVGETLDAARRAALVDDGRLAHILGVGRHEGAGFVVTEVIRGPSLLELVATGPLPPAQARAFVGETAGALEAARRRGVHHLALRPEAVHLTPEGQVMVTGLGVDAAQRGRDAGDYWASSRADAVALVALLYRALTGVEPDGATSPRELRPDIPADLERLCVATFTTTHGPTGPHDGGPHSPAELIKALVPWEDLHPPSGPATDDALSRSGRTGRRPGVAALGRSRPRPRTSAAGVGTWSSDSATTPPGAPAIEDWETALDPARTRVGGLVAGASGSAVRWAPLWEADGGGRTHHGSPAEPTGPLTDHEASAAGTRTTPTAEPGSVGTDVATPAAAPSTATWSLPGAPTTDDADRPPFDAVLPEAVATAGGAAGWLNAAAASPRHPRTAAAPGAGPGVGTPAGPADGAAAVAVTTAAQPEGEAAAVRPGLAAMLAAAVAAVTAMGRRGLEAARPWLQRVGAATGEALRVAGRVAVTAGRSFGAWVAGLWGALTAPPVAASPEHDPSADDPAAEPVGRFDPAPYVLAIMLALVLFGSIWAITTLVGAAGGADAAGPAGRASTVVVALDEAATPPHESMPAEAERHHTVPGVTDLT